MTTHRPFPTSNSRRRSAFTLTEILIVVGLIVLLIALALPAFNFISGSRSVDSAQNQIAAMLGRARAEAIGLQETRGVLFYIDPDTRGVAMALVRQTDPPPTGALNVSVYLDLTEDRDTVALPRGVGVQFIDDGGPVATPNDRYIGFNKRNGSAGDTIVEYGGVILFDGRGQLVHRTFAFRVGQSGPPTLMGRLLYDLDDNTNLSGSQRDVVPVNPAAGSDKMIKSKLGMVLFEVEPFTAREYTLHDLQVESPTGGYGNSNEKSEEDWLDENSLSLLINRYNGTLVRGE